MFSSDEESFPHLFLNSKIDLLENEPMLNQSDEVLKNHNECNFKNKLSLSNRKDKNHSSKNNLFKFGLKSISLCFLMYIFFCSLDLMSTGFRLLGGKNVKKVLFQNEMLSNPIVGVMVGILVTVLVQSSSTSTSIIVSMVSSDIVSVRYAIPIVMGANVGTSITNTIVSFMQSGDREEFGRAFAAATIHDVFNWLSVFVLLSLELCIHFLEYSTDYILLNYNLNQNNRTKLTKKKSFIKKVTNFFTETIVKVDNKVLEKIQFNNSSIEDVSILSKCCKTVPQNDFKDNSNCLKNCRSIFNYFGLSDWLTGTFVLTISILLLCFCLIMVVKLLNSILRGKIALIIKNYVNAEYKFPWSYLVGYLALLIGCIMTILVQSSSIFTSALTPLAGLDIISIERVYPLTLGSNIGTTTTGIFAALTAEPDKLKESLQIAFCHLLFNITGIIIFYPIPFLRFPITIAKFLGKTTAKYRWFAIFYLIFFFLILPLIIFAISLTGKIMFSLIISIILLIFLFIICINTLQTKCLFILPEKLHTWSFLPIWLHSLEPYDAVLINLANRFPIIFKILQSERRHDQAMSIMSSNTNSKLHILDVSQNNSTIEINCNSNSKNSASIEPITSIELKECSFSFKNNQNKS